VEAKVYITNAQPEVIGVWQEFQHPAMDGYIAKGNESSP
jgi:hypothetical protein